MTAPRGIYLENDLLQSDAFKAIKSPHTFRMLLEFYRRRVIHKPKDRRNKHSKPIIVNNGQIELPYRYAIEKMGFKQTTFSRSLDEVVELGLIDVAAPSCGLRKIATKYSISERWRRCGNPDFVVVKRERLTPPFARKRKSQLPRMDNSEGNTVTTDGQ